MGVHGLWRLIEPSGKTVPVETLENKILAVDVSIWLHQAVKGFQDAKGQPLPNAHLLGIYHRVCKLLYFRVKPIFVFDGGVPVLKKQTMAKRNQQKTKNFNATGRIHKQLLSTLLKHSAVNKVLLEKAKEVVEKEDEKKETDLFALPPQIESFESSSSSESSDFESDDSPTKNVDIHSIDMESADFRSLPPDVRHEILTEVKETRKQSSWGRLHELPTQSDDFAVFQMNRLRKRYQVQVSLEEAEKEMGGHSLSLIQLEQLLNDQGVVDTKNLEIGKRIASDENTRYLLIKDVKKAVEEATETETRKTKADLEFENDLKKAIELSQKEEVKCEASTSQLLLLNSSSSDEETDTNVLSCAKNYMMEYSGLTPVEIGKIIGKQVKTTKKIDEKIPILSDSSSEDDLIEVVESADDVKSGLEIVVQPTNQLDDDDLFSDVFEERIETSDENVVSSSEIVSSTTSPPVVVVVAEEKKEESIKSQSPPKNRNEVIIEKEKTVNTVREMLKNVKEADKVSVDELKELQVNLSQESKELRSERATKERMASNITDQMYQEAQELLELFGVPYIVAPMEAEAQCAFLDAIGLTDGTITDDSDIWLFGGKTVYKNFFNQTKHVMEFKAENIQHSFKLTREQMILLALLVGSDYTSGIQGIGPVTALEILAAFPYTPQQNQILSGLIEFRKWYFGKTTKTRNSLRKKLKNLIIADNFPSLQVVQAYLDPPVETSKENFSWAKPDLVGLIDFAKEKFGWTKMKSEEILKPVLKRLEERFAQSTILDYFKSNKHKIDGGGECEKFMSKRVKKALEKIGGKNTDDEQQQEKQSKKMKSKPSTSKLEQDPDIKILKETKIRSRRRLQQMEEEANEKLQTEKTRKSRVSTVLHTKEVIIQKELDKKNVLRSKLKAIEVFRKSKEGPGYVKKRQKVVVQPKKDAELSESDSSN